jgi:DNA-binding NarL/FixJ family response regulator
MRILVVDDYQPWRRFVCVTLDGNPELQVVGEVSDGLEAVEKAQELRPDLILLDIGLPTLNGIEAARRILRLSPQTKVLFVSENHSVDIAIEALRAGGRGYVIKSNAAGELVPAINAVLQGGRFISRFFDGADLVDISYPPASENVSLREVRPAKRPHALPGS